MFIMLMDTDSTGIDSLKTYEIPAIINHAFDSNFTQRIFSIKQEIIPDYYDLDISDALYKMPWSVIRAGMDQPFVLLAKGQVRGHYHVFLNNHRLYNALSGISHFDNIIVQFIDKIYLSSDQMHNAGLNILTKTNHYDRPFSLIQYSTGSYGSDLYTADLSRPLTNDLGFYLSGIHRSTHGHRTNNGHTLNAYYANFYWQKIIPGRMDIIYASKTIGFPGSDQDTLNGNLETDFIDASICTGNDKHKFSFYYTADHQKYLDLNTLSPFHDATKTLGADIANYHSLMSFEGEYRLAGAIDMIESDAYGSYNTSLISYWTRLTKRFNKISLSGSCLLDLRDTEHFYAMPKLMTGIELFDSVFIFGSLARFYRSPTIMETHEPDSEYSDYYPLAGNPDLEPEYYWSWELSAKRNDAYITLYRHDYDDRILLVNDNDGRLIAQNTESWQTIGIESVLSAKLYLSQNIEKEKATMIGVSYYGNYLIRGDTMPLLPKGNSSIDLSIERQTHKYTIGAKIREQFNGTRQDLLNGEIDGSRIFSSIAYLRILDLHFSFRCDNIFNEEYSYIPGYLMPTRNYSLSIKWNFRD